MDFFAADVFFAACQCFEFFIGLFDAVAAHHGLDGFGEQGPGGIQIGGKRCRVGFEFVEAAQVRRPAEQGVAAGHAHVA